MWISTVASACWSSLRNRFRSVVYVALLHGHHMHVRVRPSHLPSFAWSLTQTPLCVLNSAAAADGLEVAESDGTHVGMKCSKEKGH